MGKLPSLSLPGPVQFAEAQVAFELCCLDHEIERQFGATGGWSADEAGPERNEAGSLENWRVTMRAGAPDFVRANLWLLLWWAQRSFRYESPVAFWLGSACVALVTLQVIYGAIRRLLATLILGG